MDGERTATIDHGARGGDVIFTDGRGTLRLAWEMASFGIEIGVPTADRWEAATGIARVVDLPPFIGRP